MSPPAGARATDDTDTISASLPLRKSSKPHLLP